MEIAAKITSKNQITIPKAVRDSLHLGKGDKTILFNIHDNQQITVEKPHQQDLWTIVAEQAKKYGSVDTPEIDWGDGAGEERID